MSSIGIENFIKEFDGYIKKSKKFNKFQQIIDEKTSTEFSLEKVIKFQFEKLYKTGKDGKKSFIREISSENLMGTRVGQIFNTINKFFYTGKIPKKDGFDKFIMFLKELNNAIINNMNYEYLRKIVLKALQKDNLLPIRTVIIQILSVYFPKYFLPIYQLDQMLNFIKELKIDLVKLPADFGGKFLIVTELLVNWKNNTPIAKKWNNLIFSHFLYFCLPLDDLKLLRSSNLGIQWLEINEQFVVAIFMKLNEKLGFPKIINIRTSYPDCEVENSKGEIKFIEFEFMSSGFLHHKDLADRCDYVVCWDHDYKEKWLSIFPNIEVLAFKDILEKL